MIAVIGFSTDNLSLQERIEDHQTVQVVLVTSAEPLQSSVKNSHLDVTVKLTHTASNATLGKLHQQYVYMYYKKFF